MIEEVREEDESIVSMRKTEEQRWKKILDSLLSSDTLLNKTMPTKCL